MYLYNQKLKSTTPFQVVNSVWLGIGCLDMKEIALKESFFQFMVDTEQSRTRISDARSITLISSLIATFYLSKTKTRTEESLTQLSCYCFE